MDKTRLMIPISVPILLDHSPTMNGSGGNEQSGYADVAYFAPSGGTGRSLAPLASHQADFAQLQQLQQQSNMFVGE